MATTKREAASGIVIRRESGLPVYRQLVDQLRFLIGAGRYRSGTYLPTMRELADELGLNLNTVNRAYRQLQRDGLVRSTPGRGALVVPGSNTSDPEVETRPVVSAQQTDAILAAAIERALSAGLAPRVIAARVEAILAEFDGRVPPPPRIAVAAGREWRTRALAGQLATVTGREVESVAGAIDETDAPSIVVRPQFGTWRPDVDRSSEVVLLDVQVVPSRDAVRRLVDLEPGSAVCVVAADEPVARWIADAATFASPSRVRWEVREDATGLMPRAGEIVLCEAGLPGMEVETAIGVAPTFALTVGAEIERALGA